jgi:hypothetical protein
MPIAEIRHLMGELERAGLELNDVLWGQHDNSYAFMDENMVLPGTNFTGANLNGAELEGITYDKTTVWPAGFKPPRSRKLPANSYREPYSQKHHKSDTNPMKTRYTED